MPTSLHDLLHAIDDAVEGDEHSRALSLICHNWDHLSDPAPLRERSAMVLATIGRKKEAVEIYRLVARHYANAGYPTRALASVKQIQALNPSSTQLLDHFTTLYSVRSPFLDKSAQQQELPAPSKAPDLQPADKGSVDELLDQVVELASDAEGTVERPGDLPALPLLSLLPPKALRRLLDFVDYEIYAETQPIVGPDQTERALYWAVGSDLVIADGEKRYRVPAGGMLGLSRFGHESVPPTRSVIGQRGSECLRLDGEAVDALADEFPDFPNRLATLYRHSLTEGLFSRHPLFAELDEQTVSALPENLVGLKLEADTVIVRQGALSPGLYIILDGQVQLVRHQESHHDVVDTLSPGEMVGDIGLIDPRPAIATAVTTTAAHVLFFDRESFVCFADEHPSVAQVSEERAHKRVETIQAALAGDEG